MRGNVERYFAASGRMPDVNRIGADSALMDLAAIA